MITTVYLDLDGVCSNFSGWALKTHGVNHEMKVTQWDIESQIRMPREAFRKPINDAGAKWWADMPELPWFRQLYDLAAGQFDDLFFATDVAGFSGAADGKRKWIEDRLGEGFDKIHFTAHKYCLADKWSVLIDDKESNIEKFNFYGGHGILFPASYNRIGEMNDTVGYVEEQIKKVKNKIASNERFGF